MTRMTMKNIAELAGVDKSIVSKVINGVKNIPASREKVARVRTIIKEYNYTPLSSAKSLATNRTQQLAFLLSSSTEALYASPAFGQMFSGVVRACREHHYQCQADICDFSDIKRFVMPDNMKKRSIDGCILAGNISDESFGRIAALDIPLVVLGGEYISDRVPALTWNSYAEFAKIFELFLAMGHRHIWCGNDSENFRKRLKQLRPESSRLQIEIIKRAENDEIKCGRNCADHFAQLSAAERPTLIWGCDQFCCAFISQLATYGLRCPDDVSVLSSSETEMAACCNPPLSTYSVNFFDMGYRGGELMLEILQKNLASQEAIKLARNYIMEGEYIDRNSIHKIKN